MACATMSISARRWVVATKVGGITEQLSGEPLARLCDPTPESLVAALRGLLENPPDSPPGDDPRVAWQATASALVGNIGAMLAARPASRS